MGDYYGSGRRSSSRRETKHEYFEEGDVWEVVDERESSSSPRMRQYSNATSTPRIAIAPPPPQARTRGGEGRKVAKRSSAPVNIPDWSKIYGGADVGPTWSDHGGGGGEVEDEEEEMVPPHEWLARKLGGSQISSFSVCEGIGRTLKGRDLSQVRDAILSKTGFLE